MKIAAGAYAPQPWDTADALRARLSSVVAQAAAQGAEFLLFPEYAGCEAALQTPLPVGLSADAWAKTMAGRSDAWRDLHAELAQQHGVWIIAGSLCTNTPDGLVNRAYVLGPKGQVAWQDKLILTPYERDQMGLVPGAALTVFDTGTLRFGILICYDSEFPLLARALVEEGADMLLVPSATDFPAGQTRVRQSCRARAIEGQCLVVQSPVLGRVPECDVLDVGTGRAGFFVPPDYGLPSDGVLAQGETDTEGWIIADVDLSAISAPRHSGQVGNFAHWPEQFGHIPNVQHRRLG